MTLQDELLASPTPRSPQSGRLAELPVSARIKIAGLWTSMMFVFVYIDLFSLYRSETLDKIQGGEISGFTIDNTFLTMVTVFVLIPSLMVFLTLVLRPRVAQVTNIGTALAYAAAVVASAFGEPLYWWIGTIAELALLAGIAGYALTWPRVQAID